MAYDSDTPRDPIARRWILRLLFVIVLGVVIGLLIHQLRSLSHDPWTIHKEHHELVALIHQLKAQAKFVVVTQTLTVQAQQSDEWRFSGLYLGTTEVKLRVDGCQVQYIVPLDHLDVEAFTLDRPRRRLTAHLPKPLLDESFVEIPADPDRWHVQKASGWARFDKDQMEQQVRHGLRSQVLETARQQGLDDQTLVLAQRGLVKLFQKFLQDDKLDVQIVW